WHHGRVRVGASLYAIDYRDLIYLADTGVEDGGTPVRAWNQADARFTGGELDLQWALHEGLHGSWTLRTFADAVRGRLDGDGTRPRLAPGRTGAELRFESDAWRAGIGAIHHARQHRVAAHEAPTPGYLLVNANLAWHRDTADGSAMELFVDASNLLDREARP